MKLNSCQFNKQLQTYLYMAGFTCQYLIAVCYLIQQPMRNLTCRLAEIISVNNISLEPDLKGVNVSRVAVLKQHQTGNVV